jgi:hypothetical protein
MMTTRSSRFAAAVFSILVCNFAGAQTSAPAIVKESKHAISPRLGDLIRVNASADLASRNLSTKNVLFNAPILNFDGTPGTGYNYSDATGAVGATQYVQSTNLRYTVYSKTTGKKVAGPFNENALWKTFGGACQTSNNGDGVVMYDQAAARWVFHHHAEPVGGPYLNCVAVSASSDATGSYYLYAFENTVNLPDEPKMGVWPDAYYLGQNLLNPATKGFQASQACALDRNNMLLGNAATAICFQGSISLPTIVPVSWEGSNPPPLGAPEYFFELDQRPGKGMIQMNEFLFHVDFVTPGNSTYTSAGSLALPAYKDACPTACVPQFDTTNTAKATGDRLMPPLVYRNFGDHESVLLTHSVSTGKTITTTSGIRWYELRTPVTPVIYQYGTFTPDANYRFVPSMGMDQMGDIAVGYSVSGPTIHPAVRYTGWTPADPLGQMEAETSIIEGTGSQQAANTTWSNYSGMSVDPADDCTFWYTNEYYAVDSPNKWNTRIASFKFPSCSGTN